MRALIAAAIFATTPVCAQQTIKFVSLDADVKGGSPTSIEATLFMPRGGGPFPAIVMLHGCSGLYQQGNSWGYSRRHHPANQLSANHQAWGERMQSAGYVVLLPDSFGPRGIKEICTVKNPLVTASRDRTRDAYGALLWLQSQAFVRPDRVGLMGWSNGGGTVMRTVEAKADARPASVPKGDFGAAVAFYPGCLDPKRSKEGRDWRTHIPLMVLFGADDDWASPGPCRNLAEAAAKRGEPFEFVAYPGAYHAFDSEAPVRLVHGLARAPTGTAHVGTNKAARDDAIKRTPEFFHAHLR